MTDRDRSRRGTGVVSPGDWARLPEKPEVQAEGVNDPLDLEVFDIPSDDTIMILPRDEDMVREDAFIIAASSAVRELAESR